MGTVFISYRRESGAGEARALFNDLVAQLGHNSVFMDVDSIALGRDFRGVLHEILARCDLMLVLIDRNWTAARDDRGRARLENPSDFVRLEIETALRRNIVVTPVLVQGAQMPASEQLPPEIADLAYRNAFELSHGRWESDVQEMVRRLGLNGPKLKTDTARMSSASNLATSGMEKPDQRIPFHRTGMGRLMILVIAAAVPLTVFAAYYGTRLTSQRISNSPPVQISPRSPDHFGIPDYLGDWFNLNPAAGIAHIELREAAGKPTVQIWGKCGQPTDCDWGVVDATPLRSGVGPGSAITSLEFRFNPGTSEKQVTLHLIDRNVLSATVMTRFTDGSGRADHEITEKFRRS
jgi:TIR domain